MTDDTTTDHRNRVLALMCGVIAMTVIDLAVVNVALPSIQRDLHVATADLQYVVVAYGVFVAGFLLLGGRTGDLLGHRRMLVAGIVTLALFSLVAGLAHGLVVLIVGRAGQGLGAALAAPNALATVSSAFAEGSERNRALGIFAAAGGTAAIVGSIIGGALVQGVGWQWVFWLNVPLGLGLAAGIASGVPADAPERDGDRPDVTGAVALTLGLMAAAFGVHESAEQGWGAASTLAPLLGGLALVAGFLIHQGRTRDPLIPLTTLRRPTLVWANLSAALMWASFLGLIYQATLFLQQGQGWGPLASGSAGVPIAVLTLVTSSALAPRVMNRIGPAPTLAGGLVIMAGAFALLIRVPDHMSYAVDMVPAYAVLGVGLGVAQVAVQIAAFSGIPPEETGLAGGANETSRELGGAIGLALLVSITLSGASGLTDAFHRSVAGATVYALLAALVAAVPLWRAQRMAAGAEADTPPGRGVARDHA